MSSGRIKGSSLSFSAQDVARLADSSFETTLSNVKRYKAIGGSKAYQRLLGSIHYVINHCQSESEVHRWIPNGKDADWKNELTHVAKLIFKEFGNQGYRAYVDGVSDIVLHKEPLVICTFPHVFLLEKGDETVYVAAQPRKNKTRRQRLDASHISLLKYLYRIVMSQRGFIDFRRLLFDLSVDKEGRRKPKTVLDSIVPESPSEKFMLLPNGVA